MYVFWKYTCHLDLQTNLGNKLFTYDRKHRLPLILPRKGMTAVFYWSFLLIKTSLSWQLKRNGKLFQRYRLVSLCPNRKRLCYPSYCQNPQTSFLGQPVLPFLGCGWLWGGNRRLSHRIFFCYNSITACNTRVYISGILLVLPSLLSNIGIKSVSNICTLTWDRYVAIVHPFKYNTFIIKRRPGVSLVESLCDFSVTISWNVCHQLRDYLESFTITRRVCFWHSIMCVALFCRCPYPSCSSCTVTPSMWNRTTTSVQLFVPWSCYLPQTTNSQHSSLHNCFSRFLFGLLRDRKFLSFMPDFFLPSVHRKSWSCGDLSLGSELRSKSCGLNAFWKRDIKREIGLLISHISNSSRRSINGRSQVSLTASES